MKEEVIRYKGQEVVYKPRDISDYKPKKYYIEDNSDPYQTQLELEQREKEYSSKYKHFKDQLRFANEVSDE